MSKISLQILSICLTITSVFAVSNDINTTNVSNDNNLTNIENNRSVKYVCGTGKCSWYGARFNGSRTASGERFDSNKKTAAHRSLPFGTLIKVTDTKTDKNVIVKVNDRGPFVNSRVLDISQAAARELGVVDRGVFHAKIEVIE